ncbi:MAG: polyketide synthase, partial [Moorea sp. SIO3G5]|nr:polyketide synthase [Moorena sp. SIO3G5]
MNHLEEDLNDNQDIAIIGISGRFPGANDIEQFWHNIKDGVESISLFSEQELLNSGVEKELINKPSYVRAGNTLPNIDMFDAGFFGYTPKQAEELDPQQRLFLECAWEVIERAGYNPDTYEGAIGVYASMIGSGYLSNNVNPNLKSYQLTSSSSSFQQYLSNNQDYFATRVAYNLNLTGPAIGVQTACSSSLVAVHLACQSLLNGECDMALVGGVSIRVPQEVGYLYQDGIESSHP